MLLIATDEAGYGPKLGPLVITATAWRLNESLAGEELDSCFDSVRSPTKLGETKVVVDDSKAVYKPASAAKKSKQKTDADGLERLHAAVSVANRWCGSHPNDFHSWLACVASEDFESLQGTPWLANACADRSFTQGEEVDSIVEQWRSDGAELLDASMRVLSAAKFNSLCDDGKNKAEILSEATLMLVGQVLRANRGNGDKHVRVFCDRHGGRRYYASVIQHCFPDYQVNVISESAGLSRYAMSGENLNAMIEFTVKGDRFTPVALSSIYAKYVRERLMQSFNAYFRNLHADSSSFKPTAGYPTDAERFLKEISSTIQRESIQESNLIRQR